MTPRLDIKTVLAKYKPKKSVKITLIKSLKKSKMSRKTFLGLSNSKFPSGKR
jgi:hypothetical protein